MKLREEMPKLEGATAWINRDGDKDVLVEGRVTLIHFWSISCHLCKLGMPKLKELIDVFEDHLNVISVHMPRTESDFDSDKVKNVAEQFNISQPIFIDNQLNLTDAFENQYVPAYYIFDSEGKLRHFQAGGDGMPLLIKRLERILRKA
ncbi:MAG TPA: redoxin domain-containing protein [Candidatus Angelobacter sp.]|nr:redoxin domain-containing protein [Candidatus Angelobacter sp.]